MKNIVFLPQWYIDKSLGKLRYKCKVILVLLLCLNVILLSFGVSRSYNSKIVKQNNFNKDSEKADLQKNEIEGKKELNALKSMNYFCQDFGEKISYSNVEIEDKKISFETTIQGKNNYYEIIKHIEEQKKYRILSISQIEDNVGKIKIKISLEVIV